MSDFVDDPSFWDKKYRQDKTGWDLNSANPVFVDLINEQKEIKPGSILILGAGKGHDGIYAASKNYDVTIVDFSSEAIAIAETYSKKEGSSLKILHEDIFKLDIKNKFDLLYDYTSFCAINPERRKEYAEKVSSFLKVGGKLIAHLFPIDSRLGGPPFNIDPIEFYKLFSKYLSLDLSTNKINSVKPRKGNELLQIYTNKDSKNYASKS